MVNAADSIAAAVALATGTGADQADLGFSQKDQSIAASSTYVRDLAGAITDWFGDTITMAKLKGILVVNKSGNGAEVQITSTIPGKWSAGSTPSQANNIPAINAPQPITIKGTRNRPLPTLAALEQGIPVIAVLAGGSVVLQSHFRRAGWAGQTRTMCCAIAGLTQGFRRYSTSAM